MADSGGKYQYLEQEGRSLQEGTCRVQFDAQTFTLTPESGAPLAFDLGDLDSVVATEWKIGLALFFQNCARCARELPWPRHPQFSGIMAGASRVDT